MMHELLTEAARRGYWTGVLEGTASTKIKTAVTDYLTGLGIAGATAYSLTASTTESDTMVLMKQ
jgi:hypothetical protein